MVVNGLMNLQQLFGQPNELSVLLAIIILIGVSICVTILVILRLRFIKNYKLKIVELNFKSNGLSMRIVGRSKSFVDPDETKLFIKTNVFDKGRYYEFPSKLINYCIDLYTKTERNILLFGELAKDNLGNYIYTKFKHRHAFKYEPMFTKESSKILFESKDLMKDLSAMIRPPLDDELTKLKHLGRSTLELARDVQNAKDEFVRGVGTMSKGLRDATKIIAEIFGLREDELDERRVNELREHAENKRLKDMINSGKLKLPDITKIPKESATTE